MSPEHHPSRTLTRRTLLQSTIAAAGAWSAAGLLPRPASAAEGEGLAKGSVVLFQGDSITDAGRNRGSASPNDPSALGTGYPFLLAAYLLGMRPEKDLKVYNRGISGNKVPDLDARWEKDALDLEPAVLSILIGVNDLWHKLGGHYAGTVDDYEKGYGALLERTRKAIPSTRIVVCEPFVLRCGAVNETWFPEFDARRAAAARVAKAAGTVWVPFQEAFDEAVKVAPPAYWAGDGVHPTIAGHALMARTWLQAVKP